MILVTDNAPYHHAREIGSLSSYSKKKLIEVMSSHGVDYIDLPFVNEDRYNLIRQILDNDDDAMEDRGDCIRLSFNADEQVCRARRIKPRIANLEECCSR